jgi:hypothetical protein
MKLNSGMALALVCVAHLPTTQSAMGITIELTKKCGALTDKVFRLRVPGRPAVGREHGTADEARAYFNKCVANKGNVEEPLERENHIQTPNEGSDEGGQALQKRRTFSDGLI